MKSYQKILSVVLSLLLLLTFVLPNFAEAQSIEQPVQPGTEVQGSDGIQLIPSMKSMRMTLTTKRIHTKITLMFRKIRIS